MQTRWLLIVTAVLGFVIIGAAAVWLLVAFGVLVAFAGVQIYRYRLDRDAPGKELVSVVMVAALLLLLPGLALLRGSGEAPAGEPSPATEEERLDHARRALALAQATAHDPSTPLTCSSCGSVIPRIPGLFGDVEGQQTWMGNACVPCGRVYCQRCIVLGGPTPCPICGTPTNAAQKHFIMQFLFSTPGRSRSS